jgi:hypothetical protein
VRKAVFCCYLLSGRELRSTRRLDLDLGLVSDALSGVETLSGSRLIEEIRRATIKFRGKRVLYRLHPESEDVCAYKKRI